MGLKIKSLESGGILNIAKYLLSNSMGHAELDSCEIATSLPLRSWSFLLFRTLMTMKPSLKEKSLLILDTLSNLKKPAKDKTYMVTLRSSTGLSRSDFLIMSWIKVAEIGLFATKDTSTKNSLGRRPYSFNNWIISWEGDSRHVMGPF